MLIPKVPTSNSDDEWIPKIALTPSRPPALITVPAPPGASSAG